MSVETRGRSAVARGMSAVVMECLRHGREMPWKSVDTAAVLRQKDK